MEKNVYSKWSDEWSANKTMIKIADIKELKLNITWKLLYRGLLEKQISINEIIQYAKEQLEKGGDRIEICELAGSSDYDLEDVMDTLYELAKEEKNPDDFFDKNISVDQRLQQLVDWPLFKKFKGCTDFKQYLESIDLDNEIIYLG